MSITIREYQPGDDSALVPIYESFGRYAGAGIYPLQPTAIVAVRDGEVAGVLEGNLGSTYCDSWAPAGLTFPQAYIDLMIVREDSRGEGIGSALVRFFAHQAIQEGLTFLALQVEEAEKPELQKRVRFFQKLGLYDLDRSMPNSVMGCSLAEVDLATC